MSQISKALKKVQEFRQNYQMLKGSDIFPMSSAIAAEAPIVSKASMDELLEDAPQAAPMDILMVLVTAGIVVAILISTTAIILTMQNSKSKQNQVLSLEKTIKNQEKRINNFITAINMNQKFTDNQIRDLNFLLNKESKDIKVQIDSLASTDGSQYDNLKGAILNDKQEIDFLDNYTKKLDQKIESISVSMSQANSQPKDVTSPSSGT